MSVLDFLLGRHPSPEEDEEKRAAHEAWRNEVHRSRNLAVMSEESARKSKRVSEEIYHVAQEAIRLIEGSRNE